MSIRPNFSSITFDITTDDGWLNMRRWLVGHRKRQRLTQQAVGERMGWSQSQVSEFERGLTDPYLSSVFRYIRAVDLAMGMDTVPDEAKERV